MRYRMRYLPIILGWFAATARFWRGYLSATGASLNSAATVDLYKVCPSYEDATGAATITRYTLHRPLEGA